MQRHYPQAPISAVAAIILSKGHVLLGLRRNPPSQGKWSVPGGVQDLGETLEEAVRREVREETGLAISNLRFFHAADVILHDAEGQVEYHYVILYYVAHPSGGTLSAGDDMRDVQWCSLAEAEGLNLPPHLLKIVSRAFDVDGPGTG